MPDRSACPHCHRLLHVEIFYDLSVIDDEEQADKGEASLHNAMLDGDQDEAWDQGEASCAMLDSSTCPHCHCLLHVEIFYNLSVPQADEEDGGDQDEAGDKGEDKGWDEALTIPEGPPEL